MKLVRCSTCRAWGHTSNRCKSDPDAPLETPPHNGPYRGPVPVRTVPMATSGSDLKQESDVLRKASRGHAVQSRLAAQRKLQQMNLCLKMSARKKQGYKPGKKP